MPKPKALTEAEFQATPHHSRDATYGPGFFKFVEIDHGPANREFGRVLAEIFQPRTAVEFGCGTGGTLFGLHAAGVEVCGVDGSEACLPFVGRYAPELMDRVIIHDMGEHWPSDTPAPMADLAISIEMLEHIAPEGASTAVKLITEAAPIAVITACPKIGRNPLHLNEQPFEYWIQLFQDYGHVLDTELSARVRGAMRELEQTTDMVIPAWFFSSYLGVFKRIQPDCTQCPGR